MKKFRIGVDIGGTNIKIALVDNDGKIVYSNTTPTRAEMGYEYTINNIKQAIRDLMKETKADKSNIEAIGFGFPGQIDYKEGIVRILPNIPGWIDVPVKQIIEKEFGGVKELGNLIKTACKKLMNIKDRNSDRDQINSAVRSVERNFGGLPGSVKEMKSLLKKTYNKNLQLINKKEKIIIIKY